MGLAFGGGILVLQSYFSTHLGATSGFVSRVVGGWFLWRERSAFMSILVNPLIDRGYFRLCFNGGGLIISLGILVTSWCRKFWEASTSPRHLYRQVLAWV